MTLDEACDQLNLALRRLFDDLVAAFAGLLGRRK